MPPPEKPPVSIPLTEFMRKAKAIAIYGDRALGSVVVSRLALCFPWQNPIRCVSLKAQIAFPTPIAFPLMPLALARRTPIRV